ncbi:MAG: hypothetical protein HRF50_05700 [Phycisphaerae bacterium]|jgi:hypothetical protein
MLALFGLILLAAQSVPPEVDAGRAIEPSPTAVSWEFDFRYIEPRRIEVNVAGRTEVYWYLVYTVTNRGGATQRFHPTFQLVTEDLKVIDTDMGISALVFDAIRERHKKTHPYLVHPTKAIGELRVGDDYAIESAAIWRASDLTANAFTIFVAGLSGEARIVENPAYDPSRPESKQESGPNGGAPAAGDNARFFTIRKTLALHYLLPGSMNARQSAEPKLLKARWIMR